MSRLSIICLLLGLLALPTLAQEATINAPAAGPTATKYVVKAFSVGRDCLCATVTVERRTSGGAVVDEQRFDIISVDAQGAPTATDINAFLTAIGSARATETGTVSRRMNFRVLGYLSDSGRLSGVTLVP